MSKKIFSIKYDTISTNYPNGRIFDNEKQHTLYIDEVVNLLNWLNSENKELKQENKKLKEEWEFSFRTEMAHHRFEEKELKEKIRKQQSTITELNKQNEQLRKELDSFNPVMFQDMRKGTIILYSKGGIDE